METVRAFFLLPGGLLFSPDVPEKLLRAQGVRFRKRCAGERKTPVGVTDRRSEKQVFLILNS